MPYQLLMVCYTVASYYRKFFFLSLCSFLIQPKLLFRVGNYQTGYTISFEVSSLYMESNRQI